MNSSTLIPSKAPSCSDWNSSGLLIVPPTRSAELAILHRLAGSGTVAYEEIQASGLVPEDFAERAHRDLFAWLSERHALGNSCDPAILKVELDKEQRGAVSPALLADIDCMVESDTDFHDLVVAIQDGRRERVIAKALADAHGRPAAQALAIIEKAKASFPAGRGDGCLAGGHSLTEIAGRDIDHSKTLLGKRWLCSGARGGLVVAPTGVGKSVVTNQSSAFWSIGESAFGIEPSRPLRILIVQAENDAGDETESTAGIFRHFDFSEEERALIGKNTLTVRLRGLTGAAFLATLRGMVREWKPDVVIIDPLGVYIRGGDVKDSVAVSEFFDDGPNALNVLTAELDFGALVICHTPKTNHRDTSGWKSTDWAYASAGSAVLNNSTGCSLVIDQVDAEGKVFKFIAAKRGSRLGWPDGVKYFCHGDDGIYWRDARPEDLRFEDVAEMLRLSTDHVLEILREHGSGAALQKNVLISKARLPSACLPKGLPKARAREAIDLCAAEGRVWESTVNRKAFVSAAPPEEGSEE